MKHKTKACLLHTQIPIYTVINMEVNIRIHTNNNNILKGD